MKFAALLLLFCLPVRAELVTEFGGGWKFSSSDVLDPRCRQVLVTEARDGWEIDPGYGSRSLPCGGRNPLSIIWPLAWDFPHGRIGWLHISDYPDGPPFNSRNEVALNCLCATWKHSWSIRR